MGRRKARIQQQEHKACEVSTLIDHKSKKEEGKIYRMHCTYKRSASHVTACSKAGRFVYMCNDGRTGIAQPDARINV